MNVLVIYTSQTGFTKRYAEWLSSKMNGDLLNLQDAKKKKEDFFEKYDAIVYGGWAMAGSVVGVKWFYDKAVKWKNKKLVVFCVGASPEANPDVDKFLNTSLTEEQKGYIKLFYCQGGLDYSKMKAPSKLAMKAFTKMLKSKKDANQTEKDMAKMIESSYDISDQKYVDPIVEYLEK